MLPPGPTIPLAMLSPGETGEVQGIRGGRGMARHLADMGIVPGALVTVVSDAGSAGPLILRVLDGRIMLGRGMAHRIIVRPM